MTEPGTDIKAEIEALETVLTALAPLDEQTRGRVLAYVRGRFGDATAVVSSLSSPVAAAPAIAPPVVERSEVSHEPRDIRSLKEAKQPGSAVEMAVLVGYYLTEMADPSARKASFGTPDVNKYFKQAGYRLPTHPNVTLHQAKNAGYLDNSSYGKYSLNPVGHNLVTHGLPRSGKSAGAASQATRPGPRKAKSLKKKVATKKPSKRASTKTGRGGSKPKPK
jgi:hypothetical protein